MKHLIVSVALILLSFTASAEQQYSGVIDELDVDGGNYINVSGKRYPTNSDTSVKFKGQVLNVTGLKKGQHIRYTLTHQQGVSSMGVVELMRADESLYQEH